MKKFLIILLLTSLLFAGNTLPPNHWAYQSIDKFRIAGFFHQYGLGNYTLTREDIIDEIINIGEYIEQFPNLKPDYEMLQKEFLSEIQLDNTTKIRFESNFEMSYDFAEEIDNEIFNPAVFIKLNEIFSAKYSVMFDKQLDNDPNYIGREYFDAAGYQNQAFVSLNLKKVMLQFGRDYIKWGYGKAGNLLISDNSRTFDMVHLKSNSKPITFDYFLAQLDNIDGYQRFLAATRLEYRFPFKLALGIGQASLYGGENQTVDFALSNPMSISYAVQHNDSKSVNSMLYADIAYYWKNKYKFYSELLIDDFQAEDDEQGDQEPNEIGFTLGCEFVDIAYGIDGFVEFTQIRNRTYNVNDSHAYEKFIHRNEVIGHSLGCDFQYFNLDLEKWMFNKFKLGGGYYWLNKGEGTVLGTFTTPWEDEEGDYSESIPYGIVETTNRFYLKMLYHPNSLCQINCTVGYQTIDNFENADGDDDSSVWGQLDLNVFFASGF